MTVTIYQDTVNTVRARAVAGRVVEAVTEAILQSDDPATDWDSTGTAAGMVSALYDVATGSTRFRPGATFDAITAPKLYLDELNIQMMGERATARVEAHWTYYNNRMDDPDLVPQIVPKFSIATRNIDNQGDLVEVTYDGIRQVAEYTSMRPEFAVTYDIVQATNRPGFVVWDWFGKVNATTYNSWPPHHVLVQSITYRPLRVSPHLWGQGGDPELFVFSMTLAHRRDTWQPVAEWIDPSTARTPSGINTGNHDPDNPTQYGRVRIQDFIPKDFNVSELDQQQANR